MVRGAIDRPRPDLSAAVLGCLTGSRWRVTVGGSAVPRRERARGWVYVRVPALLSGLLFLVFFPEILGLGDQTFHTASGLHQDVYLARWLLTCGAVRGFGRGVRREPGPRPREPTRRG